MAQPTIQTSFASGEWAPKLRQRVDVQKYKSGASLLRNFYVDWSGGGASTRQGTQFIAQVGANGARLIPFQPSAIVTYVLEFGDFYVRFYSNGAQIMSGGLPYQIASPYAKGDLFYNPETGNPGLKYVQDVTSLIITHPNYPPYILTIISPTNWTLAPINFGATIGTPGSLNIVTTLGAGTFVYGYVITAVDVNGQESVPSSPIQTGSLLNIQSNNGTIAVGWGPVLGAVSYNVYKTVWAVGAITIPVGAQYGFIGNVTGTTFIESTPGIAPDFSQTPPIGANPFFGAPLTSITVTAPGSYTTVPSVTLGAPPAGGLQATAFATLGVISLTINHAVANQDILMNGNFNPTGSILTFGAGTRGLQLLITNATFAGSSGPIFSFSVNTVSILSPGAITGAGSTVPTNPVSAQTCSNPHFQVFSSGFNFNLTWGVTAATLIQPGIYLTAPSVSFSAGAATATSAIGPATGGNPACSAFFQERLVLAAQPHAVQSFNMSQPGSFFNFNYSFPSQADDAISGTIISEELNNIRSLTPVTSGLIAFTGKSAWLINGGSGVSTSEPVTPSNISALQQAFNGASDLRPLRINMDILYVTNKGNYVRDLTYNLYANIYTGADITTFSNHLFFGYNLVEWCWAEEPFKTLWAVRDDGQLLSMAYVKDQDLIGWAHHDTNGQFKSVCSVLEIDQNDNTVDAVYVIVERTINGSVVQNVERFANRFFLYGAEDSWSVDCALQTAPQVTAPGPLVIQGDPTTPGNTLVLTDTTNSPFTPTMAANNWIVRADGAIYGIYAFTDATQVGGYVIRPPPFYNTYSPAPAAFTVTDFYSIWQQVTTVSGLTQLLNTHVTGVADGVVISGIVDGSGNLFLGGASYTKVTVGLPFTPQLQTLPLDLGEPTVQGKRKKITALTLRVADTLGLSAGTSFSTLVPLKDFTLGNIPSVSTGVSVVSDLVAGDGRVIIDQAWQELGNYCIQQTLPYPATILGVMPEVVVGDTK